MTRGEIWTVASGGDYANKPRPVTILQSNAVDATDSITVCPITTDPMGLLFRIPVLPSQTNGLREPSHLMADKITTVPRTKLGKCIGTLSPADMASLSSAIAIFLDLI